MLNLNGNSITADAGKSLISTYGSTDSVNGRDDASVNNTRNDNIHGVNLTELNVGDVFSGEILNINNHEVSILLDGNNVVNALLKQSFALNIGQRVIFQVKDKSEGQIFIRPLADETVPAELINKSLSVAGLSVNDKNSLIVGSLIEHGQPIDRQTVIQYLKLANQFGLENLNKLIDMTKQGIHINYENLEMYDKYVHSTHQISNSIGDIADKMTGYLDKLIQGDIAGNLPEIEEFTNMLQEISDVIEAEEMGETDNPDTITGQTEVSGKMMNEAENFNGGKVVSENENPVGDKVFSENENPVGGKIFSESENPVGGKTAIDLKNFLNEQTVSDGKIVAEESTERKQPSGRMLPENMEHVSEAVKGSDTLRNVAEDILSILQRGGDVETGIKKHDLSKIKERIRDIFHEKLILDVKSGSEASDFKQQVDRLYEKLMKTADIIKNNVLGKKDGELGTSANELKNNLSFMNELNQLESYVQLPVRFSSEDANGDLYVYNRKRKKENGDEPLTAFLHLDLMYLGATDINVSLKNKGVKIVFMLDNAESEKLVLEHLDELADRLRDKGYSAVVDANSAGKETKTADNALLPITEHNENVVSIKRYTLDIRT